MNLKTSILLFLCVFASLRLTAFAAPLLPPLLTPRTPHLAPPTNRVACIIASRTGGGFTTNWWGFLYQTNLDALVVVNITNAPASVPALRMEVSWDEPATLQARTDLDASPATIPVTARRSVSFPSAGPYRFFRVPLQAQWATLRWEASPDFQVTGYKVYCGPSDGEYDQVQDVGLATGAKVEGLTPGETYYFGVTAYDGSGVESDASSVPYTAPRPEPLLTIRAR